MSINISTGSRCKWKPSSKWDWRIIWLNRSRKSRETFLQYLQGGYEALPMRSKRTPLPLRAVSQGPAGRFIIRGFSLLIVLIQRFQKCDERGDIGLKKRNAPYRIDAITKCSLPRPVRRAQIKSDCVIQGVELTIVHVGGRIPQV